MSHSHLAIRHLVKKLEMSGERKSQKPQLPAWLINFVEEFSERFEPFSGVARVGYECLKGESGWQVSLFLGEHEIVGGPGDGELRPVNFRFDLGQLTRHFDSIEGLFWNAFPNSNVCFEHLSDLSFLTIEGTVHGVPIRVQIHAGPSEAAGPAMRQYVDGRMEVV
ncbi:hypothetical protein [Planctomicrobium sp. SH664]|uniref:hypothetical protein n=1 Tax=Planctomicrobium sp. SH664 TaxID=3448125 RepID=UPI003F5B6846